MNPTFIINSNNLLNYKDNIIKNVDLAGNYYRQKSMDGCVYFYNEKNMLTAIKKLYKMSNTQKKRLDECLSENASGWPECPKEFDLKQLYGIQI